MFHKGTPVKLDVSGIPDAAQQAKVAESLTKKLAEMDCPIGAEAKVDVLAAVEGPKAPGGFLHPLRHVPAQEYFLTEDRLSRKNPLGGEPNEHSRISPSLNRGETIESVLREASKKPSYEFYNRVVLPDFLQKPSDNAGPGPEQTIGVSKVTPEGLR